MSIYDRIYKKFKIFQQVLLVYCKILFIIGYFTNYLFVEITLNKNISYDIIKNE